MIYKPYSIKIQLTGITRKASAEILSAVFSCSYEYNREENFYIVKDRAEREWKVEQNNDILCQQKKEDNIIRANFLYAVEVSTPFLYERDFSLIDDVVKRLKEAGGLINESTNVSITLKHNGYGITEKYSENMCNLIKSKAELLRKALGVFQPPDMSNLENGYIKFPRFDGTLAADRIKTYLQLTEAIHSFVSIHKRVSPRVNASPNNKFVLRTWLIRLGMIGNEYKTARAVLTEKLEGNSAWLHSEMACRQLQEEACANSVCNSDRTESTQIESADTDDQKAQLIRQEGQILHM